MKWLRAIVAELIGLFVDDGSFALAIVVWLVAVGLIVALAPATQAWAGIALFLGLAAILAESAIRRARK